MGRLWNEVVPRLRMNGAMPSISLKPPWRAQKQFCIYFISVHICLFYNDVSESEDVSSYHERKNGPQ